ncbi:MAG: hypothetical protein ABEJ67_03275 [Halanaeroarchaeum sp.]
MTERELTYEETIVGDELASATVHIEDQQTAIRVIAEAVDDRDELVLAKINQPDTTVVDHRGLPLVSTAIEELDERVAVDTQGLLTATAPDTTATDDEPNPYEPTDLGEYTVQSSDENERRLTLLSPVANALEADRVTVERRPPDKVLLQPASAADDDPVYAVSGQMVRITTRGCKAAGLEVGDEVRAFDHDEGVLLEVIDGDLAAPATSTGEGPAYDDVESYLDDVDEATTAEIAEAIGVDDTETVYERLEDIDDRLSKRRDPEDGRRKLYSLGDEEKTAVWCGRCGHEMQSKNGILSHHGDAHGDPDPQILEEEPDQVVADDGYWCGHCGDGPWADATAVDDHHQRTHGSGQAIAHDFEPDEDELVEGVQDSPPGFTDYSGTPAADGGVADE